MFQHHSSAVNRHSWERRGKVGGSRESSRVPGEGKVLLRWKKSSIPDMTQMSRHQDRKKEALGSMVEPAGTEMLLQPWACRGEMAPARCD